jgi:cell division protein FtsI/penicillin-binding protein 2
MARRRFGPLVVSVLAAAAVLVLRLGQLQLGPQSEVWAGEARELVRVGRVLPFRRGAIADRDGRVLARDVESYRAVFVQREFRRGHPLGQIAHALSAIEGRCVPLAEAWQRMDELALALVELTPRELDAFGRNGALEQGPLRAPALAEGVSAERWARRGDVAFYVVRLLGLEGREPGELQRLLREDEKARDEPYLELAARARRRVAARQGRTLGGLAPEALRAELTQRLAASRADLEHLAQMLAAEAPARSEGALASLLARLEQWRARVEDGAASDLFFEACGFWPGRVEPQTMIAHVDLGRISALLGWESERTQAWLERERQGWLRQVGIEGPLDATYALQQLLIEVELSDPARDRAQIVLDAWTRPFLAGPSPLPRASLLDRLLGRPAGPARALTVFAELDDLFAARPPSGERASATELFAFQEPERLALGARDSCEVLARAELWPPGADDAERARLEPDVQAKAEKWRDWRSLHEAERRAELSAALEQATRERWAAWEREFQERLAVELERLAAGGKLELADGRLDRASERARFALRDHGGRTAVVAAAPDYELVHLVTRRPASFAGFEIERAHDRATATWASASGGEARPALVPALLGSVRKPQLRDVYERRDLQAEFERLRRLPDRDEEQNRRFEELIARAWRSNESYGVEGIEGRLDGVLTGQNGYVEELSLQRELEREGSWVDVPPKDGQQVDLTLDVELQLAALEVLERPREDPSGERTDPAWLARPTGALVLIDVRGEVLAAASFPDEPRDEGKLPRDQARERTLQRDRAQPPGSVLKPMVAAWALDKLDLDPASVVPCTPGSHADGRPGYKTVHCSAEYGHGEAVDLHDALRRSCNSYFAWIGDTQFTPESWVAMYRAFGFGEPTGVREAGTGAGLLEHGALGSAEWAQLEENLGHPRSLMLACNGLGGIDTTVLQVARAFAGLASGSLPRLRLVRSIGGELLPDKAEPLPISKRSLEFVRRSLWACANEGGSASLALSESALDLAWGDRPLRVAAKTGSADLEAARTDEETRVRKHTWLACWFPVEEPRYVLVVFCYETLATSSHSTIWIAQQYLQHPTMKAWLAGGGAP